MRRHSEAVSVRLHGKGNLGGRPKADAVNDIFKAIQERQS